MAKGDDIEERLIQFGIRITLLLQECIELGRIFNASITTTQKKL